MFIMTLSLSDVEGSDSLIKLPDKQSRSFDQETAGGNKKLKEASLT